MKYFPTIILMVFLSGVIAISEEPARISIVDLIHKAEAGEVKTAEYFIPTHKHGIQGIMVQNGKDVPYVTHYVGESDDVLLKYFHDNHVKTRRHPKTAADIIEELFPAVGTFVIIIILVFLILSRFQLRKLKATNKRFHDISAKREKS